MTEHTTRWGTEYVFDPDGTAIHGWVTGRLEMGHEDLHNEIERAVRGADDLDLTREEVSKIALAINDDIEVTVDGSLRPRDATTLIYQLGKSVHKYMTSDRCGPEAVFGPVMEEY